MVQTPLKGLMPRLTPEVVVSEVCKEFAIDKEAVIKKGMKRNKARDMAIYLFRNHSGITCKEFGMYFGNVYGTTIIMACNRVEKEITQKKRIKGKLNKIKIRILNI